MRRLVVGDIHGAYKALKQVLKRSLFDYENDQLIIIGDVVDGWPETKRCVSELLKIKNRILVIGNHDLWCLQWMRTGEMKNIWISQGGKETVRSYQMPLEGSSDKPNVPKEHVEFFESGVGYYKTEDEKIFVHGGFSLDVPIEYQSTNDLAWDRSLYETAQRKQFSSKEAHPRLSTYSEIFVGHTTTESFSLEPVHYCELWNVDQGAGWGGKLTLMDVDNKEFWQSDIVRELYQ